MRFALSLLLLAASVAFAQSNKERGIVINDTTVYMSPDATSSKLGVAGRGREVVVLEKVNHWLHGIIAVGDRRDMQGMEAGASREVTGWVQDNAVVTTATPNGDRVVFGEAVDSESEASRRGGRRNSAQDAMRLYGQVYEYWPQSPLAGEALYRAADIQWQLEKRGIMSRPSAKLRDPDMRSKMDEDKMHLVMKKFKGTKWDDMAAYHLIENKVCGDWEGTSKCPEKEAGMYEKYADERPKSPDAPEALYNAAWRRAALMAIYGTEGKQDKIGDARNKAIGLAQRIVSNYGDRTDWVARAQALIFKIEHNVPVWGSGS